LHDADLLAVSLTDLDRGGYKLNDYLSAKKDLPDAVVMSLIAADRIRLAPRPFPSDEFRARSRNQFVSVIQQQANKRPLAPLQSITRRLRGIVLGPAFGPVAAVLLSASGAGAWSASMMARPNSVLYPAKVAAEQLQLAAAVTPDERAEISISIATARLVEADVELKAGNVSLAAVLLSQVDREFSEALAIVAAQPERIVGNPVLAQLDRRLTVLRSERDQTGALVATGTLVAANSTDSVGGAVADAASANVIASAQSTVVASASTSSQTVRSDVAASLDESVRLCRLLVAQAQAADPNAALATAISYAAVVHGLSTSDNNVVATLQREREALTAVLPTTTTSTSGAIRLALSALDDVLGAGQSSNALSSPNPIPTSLTLPYSAQVSSAASTRSDIPAPLPTPKNPRSPAAEPAVGSETKMPRLLPALPGPLIPVLSAFSPRVIVDPPNKPERRQPIKAEKPNAPVSAIGGIPIVRPAIERRRKSLKTIGQPGRHPLAAIAPVPSRVTSIGRIASIKVRNHK
jgi:hypothetical protein